MERVQFFMSHRFLVVFIVLVAVVSGVFPATVEAFFEVGGDEFTRPSRLPVHLPGVGKVVESGYTYVWDFEVVANEWYVNVPGFNFGVAREPLGTVVHELGQLPDEWAYRGIDGQKFSNNIMAPWGDPIGQVGDQIRFVFDTVDTDALGNDAGNFDAELQGSLIANALAGLATFADLSIESAGAGYTLVVQDADEQMAVVESTPFTTSPAAADAEASDVAVAMLELTADGVDSTTITVTVKDVYGNVRTEGGDAVFITTTAGTLDDGVASGSGLRAKDHGDGTYSLTLIASTDALESAFISAYLGTDAAGDLIGTDTVNFVPGTISVAANGTVLYGTDLIRVADGTQEATIHVQLRDGHGNAIAQGGIPIAFSTTGGSLSSTSELTDATGFVEVTLTSTTAEQVEVTAEIVGVGAIQNGSPVHVNFVPGEPASLRFVGQPTDSTAGERIAPPVIAEILDAHGNRVTGYSDAITVALGNDTGNSDAELRGTRVVNAVAGLATFADLYIEIYGVGYTLIVQDAAEQLAPIESAAFAIMAGGVDATQSTIEVNTDETIIGGEGAVVTVRLFDTLGNLLNRGGDDVRISSDHGMVRDLIDHGDGTYSATLIAFTPETAHVRAEVNGESIPGSVTVVFTEHPEIEEELVLTQEVDRRFSSVGEVLNFAITVQNDSDRPMNNVQVTNYLHDGLEYVDGSATQSGMGPQGIGPMASPYDPGNRTISWTIPLLQPGEDHAIQLHFQALVGPVDEGTVLINLVTAQHADNPAVASTTGATQVGTWPVMEVVKSADQQEASVGSHVRYRVVVSNHDHGPASTPSHNTAIVDALPVGFVYVSGSTRFNGITADDPTIHGRHLVWEIGDLNPGHQITLEYVTTLSLDATGADGVNTVHVRGENAVNLPFDTDPVTAEVRVRSGLFGSLGTITGIVYFDANGNGRKDPDEVGVEGVALYMDDGRRVVTDARGRYSITGLLPGLRSIKVVGIEARGDTSIVMLRDTPGEMSGRAVNEGTTVASQFVMVPVGGVTAVNFGLSSLSSRATATDAGESALVATEGLAPGRSSGISVGMVDIVVPAGSGPDIRYGSFYGRWEGNDGESVTLRHKIGLTGKLEDLQNVFPGPSLLGDESQSDDLAPSGDNTYFRWETPRSALTYGIVTPESRRFNTYASRTSPMTGLKFEAQNASETSRFAVYQARVLGYEHVDRFDELGVTGPYYLSTVPIDADSVDVWLITQSDDPGTGDIDRIRLIKSIDYTIDTETGVLWLTQAPASVDEAFHARYIEVTYRSIEPGVVGDIVGVRADAEVLWGTVGLSASRERQSALLHETIGVDGIVNLGTTSRLTYELGTSRRSGSVGSEEETGLGARLRAETRISEQVTWELAAERIRGTLRPPGRTALRAGTTIASTLSYHWSERSRITYEREYERFEAMESVHSDALRLETALGDGRTRLVAGVDSRGSDVMPGVDRRTRVHTGVSWSWGERSRLGVSAGLEARSDQEWKLVAPTQLSYRMVFGDVVTSIAYRQAFGHEASGAWIASIDSERPNGLNAYSRLETNAQSSRWTVGARRGWAITNVLNLSVGAEGRMGSADPVRTALLMDLSYRSIDGASEAALVQELENVDGEVRTTIRGWWQGQRVAGWAFKLSGSTIKGPVPVHDMRRVLRDEALLAVDYRDPVHSRHTLLAQLIGRKYEQNSPAGMDDASSRVGMMSIDWAYRLDETMGVHGKVAGKQEQISTFQSSVAVLAQVGAEVTITKDVSLELYHRALRDATGASMTGYAVELVHALSENVGISIGFSTLGLEDPDLQVVAPWPEGLYYRLRAKF